MPHLVFHGRDVDARYPSIVAPDDECLDDLATDECDQVYQTGLRAAEEIRRTMRVDGRRRRIRDAARSKEEQAQDNPKSEQEHIENGLNVIYEDLEADVYCHYDPYCVYFRPGEPVEVPLLGGQDPGLPDDDHEDFKAYPSSNALPQEECQENADLAPGPGPHD